ncbi:hypothetical protein DRN73_07685 [Candidatus Pacearchaeota archaeon]|nr:MAG: hypothetical protein DRN73_07685 [Candidatus Pacearchaeota archaeon]
MKNKKKKIFRGILLAIFSFFLIFCLNLTIYSFTIKSKVLNSEFIINELKEANFYSKIHEQILSSFYMKAPIQNQRFSKVFDNALTEEWIEEQINSLINNFFAYLNSETDELSLKISTVEFKNNVEKTIRKEIAVFVPPPIVNDEEQISIFISEVRAELNKKIPDEINIVEFIEQKGGINFREDMAKLRKGISYLNLLFYLSIILIIILISLISILTKEVKLILRRIGASFFVSGSSLYLGNFLTLSMVSSKFSEENLPNFISKEFLMKILNDILEPINFYGIIFMIIGIVLIIGSFLMTKKS